MDFDIAKSFINIMQRRIYYNNEFTVEGFLTILLAIKMIFWIIKEIIVSYFQISIISSGNILTNNNLLNPRSGAVAATVKIGPIIVFYCLPRPAGN
jgi:hypothetical protein